MEPLSDSLVPPVLDVDDEPDGGAGRDAAEELEERRESVRREEAASEEQEDERKQRAEKLPEGIHEPPERAACRPGRHRLPTNGDDQRVAGHPDERDKDRTGYEPERKAVRGGDAPPSGDDGCRNDDAESEPHDASVISPALAPVNLPGLPCLKDQREAAGSSAGCPTVAPLSRLRYEAGSTSNSAPKRAEASVKPSTDIALRG